MNCLILAAGHGSRLRAMGESKPLVAVAGRPLVEHVVRSAAAAGATRFTVVTGNEAEPVEALLEELAARIGQEIATVRLKDWDRPNGHSVVAGAERIEGDYLLMMADHLFDPAIARRLIKAPPIDGVRLAVDRELDNELVDLDDVTKVETDASGTILKIGKQLESYDAFDTGLFRASAALRPAILEAIAEGRPGSLSDGVQRLADERRAATIDVSGSFWIDVDDPKSHALAEAHLVAGREGPDRAST